MKILLTGGAGYVGSAAFAGYSSEDMNQSPTTALRRATSQPSLMLLIG